MKKGFASMTIVYSFLLVFLLTLVSLLAIYTQKARFVDTIVENGKEEISGITSTAGYQKIIYSGNNQSFLINAKGELMAWGYNDCGQLGIGSNSISYIPVKVVNTDNTKFIKISSGINHSLAIDEAGSLWAFGCNNYGQLGNGSSTASTLPTKITNTEGTDFVEVVASRVYSLAIDENGSLWAWGANGSGQLGDNSTTTKVSPVEIINTSNTDFVSISSYHTHSLAIDEAGSLWAWGDNSSYELGNNSTAISKIPIIITANTYKKVAAGYLYSAAIDTNGYLYTWGDDTYGQLGNGSTGATKVPTQITNTDNTKFVNVATGKYHMGAIDEAGALWMWGYNNHGQLGDNSTTARISPVKIINPEGKKFVSISMGDYHTQAIDEAGNVFIWGYNGYGQLGHNGITAQSLIPIIIVTSKANKLYAGNSSSYSLDTSNNLWVWGDGSYGQLGNGSSASYGSARRITNSDNAKFMNISTSVSSYYFVLGIDENGSLWTWGYNYYGLGIYKTSVDIPTKITNTDNTKFVAIGAGGSHGFAIDEVGALWAWGLNNFGQLGNGNNNNSSIPIKITNTDNTKFISVAGGNFHSLAIDEAGALWAWGYNSYGQLGNGNTNNSNIPKKITNTDNTKFVSVWAGGSHSIAIDEAGSLWAWGYNGNGQLGDGSTNNSNIPIKITNIDNTKFLIVAVGASHNLAIDEAGSLWVWGYNNYGQLGDNSVTTRTLPEKITNILGTKFIAISAGGSHSLGVDNTGVLWAWGYNSTYQLGNNFTTQSLVPTRIALIYTR